MKPPPHFNDLHFALAAEFGIVRDRIRFVHDLQAMRAAAAAHEVPRNELDSYSDSTAGICIQADNCPGGPDVWIYLRTSLADECHKETYFRLDRLELNPILDLVDTTKKALLYAFLLLHEIGHHELKHSPADSSEKKEAEADRWASNQLRPIYRRFL